MKKDLKIGDMVHLSDKGIKCNPRLRSSPFVYGIVEEVQKKPKMILVKRFKFILDKYSSHLALKQVFMKKHEAKVDRYWPASHWELE